MKNLNLFLGLLLITLLCFGCKKPYAPPEITTNINTTYLVVEGVINTGNDSTFIKLSRTTVLKSPVVTNPETAAQVIIEGDNNKTYPLKELGKGSYACAPLNVGNTGKYRLRIITAKNQIYLSDFVSVKDAPPIDSVNYVITADGVQISANAHDAANQTKYYRYEYIETWAFHTDADAPYVAKNMQIVERDNSTSDNIHDCWANNYATDIILTSTTKYANDVVYKLPITSVPSTSEKFETRYSILVKEYALTQDAFNYWQILKTNTQQLGSIFDAQPSSPNGNVRNRNNPAEPVLGYVSAGAVQQKRIFIDAAMNLPSSWTPYDPYANCNPNDGQTSVLEGSYYVFYNQSLIPYNPIYDPSGKVTGWTARTRDCLDCRLRGYNHKPSFW